MIKGIVVFVIAIEIAFEIVIAIEIPFEIVNAIVIVVAIEIAIVIIITLPFRPVSKKKIRKNKTNRVWGN